MNKKILTIAPFSLLSALIITSCGESFTRHTFKDSLTRAQHDERLAAITKEQVDATTGFLKVNSEKGCYHVNASTKSYIKENNIIADNSTTSYVADTCFCEKTNTIRQVSKETRPAIYRENTYYFKSVKEGEENPYYIASFNNLTGVKTKQRKRDRKQNEMVVDYFNGLMPGDFIFEFPNFDQSVTGAEGATCFDLCGNTPTKTRGGPIIDFADLYPDKANDLKFAKNDDKSLCVTFKTQLTFEEYTKSIIDDPEYVKEQFNPRDYSGTVDVDMFYCLENLFLTQVECRIKVNNAKVTLTKQIAETTPVDITYDINQESYFQGEMKYDCGEDVDVNLDEYSLIKK